LKKIIFVNCNFYYGAISVIALLTARCTVPLTNCCSLAGGCRCFSLGLSAMLGWLVLVAGASLLQEGQFAGYYVHLVSDSQAVDWAAVPG
jgi:hypothetical protein